MDYSQLRHLLLFDIETVPLSAAFDELSDEWKLLWMDKISKAMPENSSPAEMFIQRAGIMAEFGKIVCISTGFFYESPEGKLSLKIKTIAGDNEQEILTQFLDLINKFAERYPHFQFAGHNIKEFDIPFVCRRLVINNISLPSYFQIQNLKPWELNHFDTLQWWRFGDFRSYISLHLLASVLGVPTSKDDIDGSQVQHVYYIEKNLPRIATYCQKDVIVVAQIILRFKNLSLLDSENIFVVS